MTTDGPLPLKTDPGTVPEIDTARCSGCGRCIAACSLRLFGFEQQGRRKIAVLPEPDRCTGCGKCAVECAVGAITLEFDSVLPSGA